MTHDKLKSKANFFYNISVVNLRKRRISRQNKGETAVSQLHIDSIMPHADDVKREFVSLHLAIVPNGRPIRGVRGEAVFR